VVTDASPVARSRVTSGRWLLVLAPAGIAIAAMLASRAPISAKLCWNVAWTASAVCAFAGMALARENASGASRRRWTLWAAAAAAWLFGQLAWDVFVVVGSPPSPNIADAGYWGFAVLVIVSMLRLPGRRGSLQAVTAAEMLPLIAAVTALTFAELWSDAARSSLALPARLSALAYPTVYVLAAILTLQAIVGGSLRGNRSKALLLVLGGIIAQALAFILWSHELLRQTNGPGNSWLSPLWVIGLISIGVGGLLASWRTGTEIDIEEPSRHGGVLPAAMFIVLIVALLQAWLTDAPRGAVVTLATAMLLCGVSLIARGTLLERGLWELLARERSARLELSESKAELAALNERLVEASRRDVLTGLRNRRALSDDLATLEAVSHERGTCTAFVLCDVDHFKAYNDRLGHLAGDEALRAIASVIRGTLRAGDIAYRFGGEELLLVLRDTTAADALAVAERVRAQVEAAALAHPASSRGVLTVSIGVAPGPGDTGKLFAGADTALYEAKGGGRNRVIVASGSRDTDTAARRHARLAAETVPRHLRSMLTISRAAASGRGAIPVLEALAATIRSELSFATVVVNLLDDARRQLTAVVVLGDQEASDALLGSVNSWDEWEGLIASDHVRCGAVWLPAGSYKWKEAAPMWTASLAPATSEDSWQPDDMVLLPVRGASGRVLAVVSVDEPLSGRRPTDAELGVLMAVADHAGLALEQSLRGTVAVAAVQEQAQELLLAAVMLLAETVDLRDAGTARHCRTVGTYARQTALALGLGPARVERIHAAGVVHDLGKIGIADAIIYKPGPLTPAEYAEMQRHAEIGARILEHAGVDDIAGWVRAHHERLDGNGYPRGLGAREIALEPRILAVADAYEAMTADRPYRRAMSESAARAELGRCAGSQFDPVVVDAFLSTLSESIDVSNVSPGVIAALKAAAGHRARH